MRHAEGSYREAYDLYHQCHDELNDHLPCKSRGEREHGSLESGRAELRALMGHTGPALRCRPLAVGLSLSAPRCRPLADRLVFFLGALHFGKIPKFFVKFYLATNQQILAK